MGSMSGMALRRQLRRPASSARRGPSEVGPTIEARVPRPKVPLTVPGCCRCCNGVARSGAMAGVLFCISCLFSSQDCPWKCERCGGCVWGGGGWYVIQSGYSS